MLIHKSSPKLYKLDSKGKLRVWWVEVYTEGETAFLSTSHGLLGGSIVTTQPQQVFPTNVTKKNERNSLDQAEFEYDALIQKKLRERYTTNPTGVLESPPPKAMLAHEYKRYKDKVFAEKGLVFVQPKLDGIRCLANADGLWTRGGKLIVSCPHLLEPVRKLLELLPDGSFLDGELYNHQYHDKFQALVSLIRKQNVTKETLADTEAVVEYHIYDVSGTKDFYNRYANFIIGASDLNLPNIRFVETKPAYYIEDVETYHELCLNADYEGSIIRWGTEPYEEKRTKHLLKYKDFDDDEFTVIRVEEGKGDWQGAVKRFVCRTVDGKEFGAGVRGEREALSDMWIKQETPDWASVRYFGFTDDGIPRFPVVFDWGSGKRAD